jgi:hypothetical protein
LSWGWRCPRPDGVIYRTDQPDASELLIEELEERTLPRLAKFNDLATLLRHCEAHEFRHHLDFGDNLSFACALGNFEEARRICADWRSRGVLDAVGVDEESRRTLAESRELCALVCADDRAGIIALLHRWEADTARRWGLADIWEPSPFPVESM